MTRQYNSSLIARYLESSLIGKDIKVTSVGSLSNCQNNMVCFINKRNIVENRNINTLYIVPKDMIIDKSSIASYIKVKNPRLAFAKLTHKFFTDDSKKEVSRNSFISSSANLGHNVSIGHFCSIGNHVTIGDNTVINNNVTVASNTVIGKDCYIRSGSVVGEDGFGFDFEEDGTPVRLPHLGKVVIGDSVEIGSKCTIAKGTLGNTILKDFVKLDDQVHIGHNCVIGEKTVITACAEISGGVLVGARCWIGPNSSIIQKTVIGDGSTIGINATITKNVKDKSKVMGLESLELRSLIRVKKSIEYK
jgi:UDP-3-O-[3-hydroxymyristoyl] glucosamine N-acyltransferase LpxD